MRLEDMTEHQQNFMYQLLDLYEYEYVDETHMKDNQFDGLLVEKTLESLLSSYVYKCEDNLNFDPTDEYMIYQYNEACDIGMELYPNEDFYRYMKYDRLKEVC